MTRGTIHLDPGRTGAPGAIHVGPSGRMDVAGGTRGTFPGQVHAGSDDALVIKFAPAGPGSGSPGPD